MIKCLHLIFKFTRITTTFEMSTFIGLWLILCNMTREYAYAKIEYISGRALRILRKKIEYECRTFRK